jgi:hypothetical protein
LRIRRMFDVDAVIVTFPHVVASDRLGRFRANKTRTLSVSCSGTNRTTMIGD